MLIEVPELLTSDQVAACRTAIAKAKWIDGKGTAGDQSGLAKENLQADESDPNARAAGEIILRALGMNPLFISAALPLSVFPPLFNSYADAQHFGDHVDNSIRLIPATHHRIRTDLSATVFLTNPDDYEGGELVIADTYGEHSVKLPAGHMVLYPATSLHRVHPVPRGARVSSFFWIQSMVRDDSQRTLLFSLDTAIQRLRRDHPDHSSAVETMSVYHNLIRMWAEV